MRTGLTETCGICEATGVPVRWDMALYKHECTVPWNATTNHRYPAELKCPGESGDQVFARMLRNAGLALCGDGQRLATDAENREQWQRRADDLARERAQDRGVLF